MAVALQTPMQAVEWVCHAATTIKDASGEVIAECSGHGRYAAEDVAIAAELVRRINGFDELLTVARGVEHLLTKQKWTGAGDGLENELLRAARAVIAKVTGSAS